MIILVVAEVARHLFFAMLKTDFFVNSLWLILARNIFDSFFTVTVEALLVGRLVGDGFKANLCGESW